MRIVTMAAVATALLAIGGCASATATKHISPSAPASSSVAAPATAAPLPAFPSIITGNVVLEETGGDGVTVLHTKPVNKGATKIEISCAYSTSTITVTVLSSAGKKLFNTGGAQCLAEVHTIDLRLDEADPHGLTVKLDPPKGCQFAMLITQ